MTAIDAGGTTADATDLSAKSGRRGWSHPKQRMLLLLSVGVVVGSFMPWLETALGTYRGFAGPGQYLFYAGMLGLGGGLVPVRTLAVIQGAVVSAVAIALPVWQVVKLFSQVGFDGWTPGIGLMLVFGCGVMAARTTLGFVRPERA